MLAMDKQRTKPPVKKAKKNATGLEKAKLKQTGTIKVRYIVPYLCYRKATPNGLHRLQIKFATENKRR